MDAQERRGTFYLDDILRRTLIDGALANSGINGAPRSYKGNPDRRSDPVVSGNVDVPGANVSPL